MNEDNPLDNNMAISNRHYKILVNLNIIANIPKYSKINTCDNSIVPAKSTWGALKRFMQGETRDKNIEVIAEYINSGLEIIPTLKTDHQRNDFLNALYGCKNGLSNLSETYNDDVNIIAKITVLQHQIDKVL